MSTTLESIDKQMNALEDNINALETMIYGAIDEAHTTCQIKGDGSRECAVAWDIVEELHAEKSHRRQNYKLKNSLEVYCDDHPEADECRVYDT